MVEVFLEVVLPVALVAILGGVVGHWRGVVVAPVSSLVFYLFTPALVFDSMANTQLSAEVSLRIVGVMCITYAGIFLAAGGWSLVRRHSPAVRAGFALTALTPNVGNMGLPVSQLAFGDAGLEVAVMAFVTGSVMATSVGVSVASMAGGSAREALIAPLRYPSLYAGALGVMVNVFELSLPVAIEAPASSLAAAAVPTMLVVLGLQLQHAAGREHVFDAMAVNLARLALAPAIAWLAAGAMGLDGVNRDALIVVSAMPTAIMAIIIATEFRTEPGFVTTGVISTTMASMLSLTVLIAVLR